MIQDLIDDLYRQFQLDHSNKPDMLIINIYHYLALREELGLDELEDLSTYHGMALVVTEDNKTIVDTYEGHESEDDFYDGSEENWIF